MNNYREMYEALLRGDVLQTTSNQQIRMDIHGNIINDSDGRILHGISHYEFEKWSIKPETININGFEIPEPVREPPKEGENIWLSNVDDHPGFLLTQWKNTKCQNFWLSKGMIHRSEAAAVLHTKALWSFTAKEGV